MKIGLQSRGIEMNPTWASAVTWKIYSQQKPLYSRHGIRLQSHRGELSLEQLMQLVWMREVTHETEYNYKPQLDAPTQTDTKTKEDSVEQRNDG